MSLAIQPAGADFNDPSLPILGHDRMLNGGTMALIDFANPKLYAAQNNSFLGVKNGVPDKGATAYAPAGAGAVTFAGGGMDFNASTSGSPGLAIGTQAASGIEPTYDLSDLAADTSLLAILWRKRTAAASTSTQQLVNLTAGGTLGTGAQQLGVAEYSGGLQLYYAGKQTLTHGPPEVGAVEQLAWLIEPDETNLVSVTAYKDGEEVGTFALAYQALTPFGSAGGLRLGTAGLGMTGLIAPQGARLYRLLLENVTLSTRDPARQVARDYQLNLGRFS